MLNRSITTFYDSLTVLLLVRYHRSKVQDTGERIVQDGNATMLETWKHKRDSIDSANTTYVSRGDKNVCPTRIGCRHRATFCWHSLVGSVLLVACTGCEKFTFWGRNHTMRRTTQAPREYQFVKSFAHSSKRSACYLSLPLPMSAS